MKLSDRDRRALVLLGAALVIFTILWVATSGSGEVQVVSAVDSVPEAEKRLMRMRQLVAGVPGKEQALSRAQEELADRENGLLRAETASQAQEQLLQILRRAARAQTPPLDLRGTEFTQPRKLGENYGEVIVSVSFDAQIEQLVNLLSDLTAQPELIATSELRVGAATGKEKRVPVRLTLSGVVPGALVPEKKGIASF